MASALLEKLKKNSKIKLTDTLTKTEVLNNVDSIKTPVPALNIAFSGSLDGGLTSGLTEFAGESKSFKSCFCLLCAKAYLDKYDDAILMFYDSEMGASKAYFDSFGIDSERVLYTPIVNVEELKFELVGQLEQIQRGDHAIIVVDSIGNLASKKEVEDALSEKSSADMTRAKQLKSLTRMVTPHLNLKNIPLLVVNHVYQEIGMFPKTITSGGTGLTYSSNQIFVISRAQEKKGTDIVGYNFNINVMKSRFVREKAKIPVQVTFDGGVNKWSGLLDMALESGDVTKPSMGWYAHTDPETGEVAPKKYRESETNSAEFWDPILKREHFRKWIEDTYKIANKPLVDKVSTENKNEKFTVSENE